MFTTHSGLLCTGCCFVCSGNPCLCGGVPGWLTPSLESPISTANSSNVTDVRGTILQPCGPEADLLCAQSLWSPEYLQDSRQLLLLKAAALNNQTAQQLSSWRASVPPCTNSSANSSCVPCSDSVPAEMCGGIQPGGGAQLCNWRYVACTGRRVVALNLANKASLSSACSTALALSLWCIPVQ